MNYDSNLIPLYMYRGGPLDRPARLYDYILAEQGIIKRVETAYASADKLLVPLNERLTGLHLRPYPLQPLRLKTPRIPGRLLVDLLADARRQIEVEVLYHFRFDPGDGWRVTRPAQRQTGLWVGYTEPDPSGVVLELHSHNRMGAFFSPVDDADEQGGRFYGVIGHLDRTEPQLVVRLGLYGQWLWVPPMALFDDTGPFVEARPAAEPTVAGPSDGWLARLWQWR